MNKIVSKIVELSLIVLMGTAGCAVFAQEKPVPSKAGQTQNVPAVIEAKLPTLTEVQRLTLQNVMLDLQGRETAVKLAQSEYDRSRLNAAIVVQGMKVEGYELDIQSMSYKAVAPVPKK